MSAGLSARWILVNYSLSSNMASSTAIPATLLNGTTTGQSEATQQQEASGKNFATGHRNTAQIHTSKVTGSARTAMDGFEANCTDIYATFYNTGGNGVKVGPARVTVRDQDPEGPDGLHRVIYELSTFTDQSSDAKTYS